MMAPKEKSAQDELILVEGPMADTLKFLDCIESGKPYTGSYPERISPKKIQTYADMLRRLGVYNGKANEITGYRMPLSEENEDSREKKEVSGYLVIARRK